ncbi:MAG: FKBP-type peptidyl-prolyl cis-trans isomerase [Crocinitomicaceae bacterium]|nr:FKBP-type peptidyl-prolyl cis-trans isomerase [Crocinitomicaceae bacterium]
MSFLSCSDDEVLVSPGGNWNNRNSSVLNKNIAQKEEVNIDLYLEMRPKWQMQKTGSGLRYWIYESSSGDSIYSGDVAEVEYSVELLDGTKCYATADDEYKEVLVGQSEVESGLQEAIKLLSTGDRAKFIIPSHIAHGLLGDLNKIPPLRTLVIDLTLLGKTK